MRRPDYSHIPGNKVLSTETLEFHALQLDAWASFMAEPTFERLISYNMYSTMLQAKMLQDFSRHLQKLGRKPRKRKR